MGYPSIFGSFFLTVAQNSTFTRVFSPITPVLHLVEHAFAAVLRHCAYASVPSSFVSQLRALEISFVFFEYAVHLSKVQRISRSLLEDLLFATDVLKTRRAKHPTCSNESQAVLQFAVSRWMKGKGNCGHQKAT